MRKFFLIKLITILTLTVVYWLLISPSFTLAQEPDFDHINQIAKQMNCPTCVGVNLADCRTQTCLQWRGQIGDLLEQGYSDQQVLDYFSTQYGEQVLLAPPKRGSTLLLWVLPVVALLAGGGWLVYTLRGWNKTEVAPANGSISAIPSTSLPNDVSEDYLLQVEKDLES